MTAAALCIETLAREACDLRHDVVTYRALLSVALAQLHAAERRQAGLSAQLEALREELRRYVRA